MKLGPYPEYQETGVQWLGSVPKHWRVLEPRRVFALRREPEKPDDVHLTPSQHFGVLPQAQYMELTGSRVVLNLSGTLMQHVEPGDFISHLRTFQGGLELAQMPGKVSPAYTVVSPLPGVEPKFFRYVFKSQGYVSQIASVTDQLRDGQTMRFAEFNKTPVPVPPLSEQRMIANFLDGETAEIDTFIADQERLIELLEERRTATVAHAVTKGLAPNLPMKDSGIDWLGAIPADWAVRKLSWVSRCNSGTSISTAKFALTSSEDLNIPVIGGNGVTGYTNVANINTPRIIIGRVGALCGNVHLVQEPAWITDNALRLSFDEKFFDAEYLAHLLRARNLNDLADRTAQPLITGSVVTAQRLPHPPLSVQRSIASYLRQELAELDAAVSDAEEAIALSRERRVALISAAVTGQVDVTQAQTRGSAGEMLEDEVRV